MNKKITDVTIYEVTLPVYVNEYGLFNCTHSDGKKFSSFVMHALIEDVKQHIVSCNISNAPPDVTVFCPNTGADTIDYFDGKLVGLKNMTATVYSDERMHRVPVGRMLRLLTEEEKSKLSAVYGLTVKSGRAYDKLVDSYMKGIPGLEKRAENA